MIVLHIYNYKYISCEKLRKVIEMLRAQEKEDKVLQEEVRMILL